MTVKLLILTIPKQNVISVTLFCNDREKQIYVECLFKLGYIIYVYSIFASCSYWFVYNVYLDINIREYAVGTMWDLDRVR